MEIMFCALIILLFLWLESSEVEEESHTVTENYKGEKNFIKET